MNRPKRAKGPALAQGGLALTILALVAVVALPAVQNPPPSIAGFAPQAQEQITDAPEAQTSESGEGEGGIGSPTTGTTTTTTTLPGATTTTVPGSPATTVPRTRICYGDPPRQSEDPQSPPCVPYWQGDNGGATSTGVTGNEIRIAVPSNQTYLEALEKYFNDRFELYGRKLNLEPVSTTEDSSAMVADAIEVAAKEFFASTSYGDRGGNEFVFYDELARRRVISVNQRPSMADEAHLAKHHPYQWSYLPTFDKMARNKGAWICSALQGRPPDFAGGSEATKPERVFALVYTVEKTGAQPDLTPLTAALRDCGVKLEATHRIKRQGGDDAEGLREAQNIVIDLQTKGVTTVVCVCHTQSSGFYMAPQATKQGYFPEWLISTYMYQAEDVHVQYWDGQQVSHTFGLQWWSKQLPPEESPWYRAVSEGGGNWNEAGGPPFSYYEARWLYNDLSVIVDGLQMAGPNLTPETFAAGLQGKSFPNPKAGQGPYWQATMSFAGDHSGIDDAALVWASKSARSNWGVPGAICYARQGVRYTLATWPSDYAGLFEGPCY